MSGDLLNYLLQSDYQNFIQTKLGNEIWLDAYNSANNSTENCCFYCALIPNNRVEISLNDSSWDFSIGDGLPCYWQSSVQDKEIIEYYRTGNYHGIEPLVIRRDFNGIKESYTEISEEFRFFHNLYYDSLNNKYVIIHKNGEEEDIVIFTDNTAKIKIKQIKQFLAIKEMTLAVFFDIRRFSKQSLEELGSRQDSSNYKTDNIIYNLSIQDCNFSKESKSFSRLIGKKLIQGYLKEKSGIWPYEEDEKYEEFIIGVNDEGDSIQYSCDPDLLANYFGANPEAPHYLTPIFFSKDVLNKYYTNPEKYSVEDGCIRCGNLWLLRIDNNHSKYITVFLGDLGRDISYKEQLYWKSFNLPPDGKMSAVCWKRSFMAEFSAPESCDLYFKSVFKSFQEKWEEKFGWRLFKPLSSQDEYHYKTLRVPTTNSQNEFDEQIRGLVKILIDSINESDIRPFLPEDVTGSISKLEMFLKEQGLSNYAHHIKFLRSLQDLRSSSVAHRKGENYKKISNVFEINKKDLSIVFENILLKSIEFLEYLDKNLLNKN